MKTKLAPAFTSLNQHCIYSFTHGPVTFVLTGIIPKSRQVPGREYPAYSDTEFTGWQINRNDGWLWVMSTEAALSLLNEAFEKYYLVLVTDANTHHAFTVQRPKVVS